MPRPIKRRSPDDYQREVESISRLRTALAADLSIPESVREDARAKLDVAILALVQVVHHAEKNESELEIRPCKKLPDDYNGPLPNNT